MSWHIKFIFPILLLCSSAIAFYTSSSSEEYEDFSPVAQFYYSKGSYHVTNTNNATFGCIKIAKYKDGSRRSLQTKGGQCVFLYARNDCTGPKLVAPPGYDSDFVYDDVGSFSPCPPTQPSEVSLFEYTQFTNLLVKYSNINACKNLPEGVTGKVSSVNTHGTCVRLYEYRNCQGKVLEMTPTSMYHWDLERFEFGNRASSINWCLGCSSFELQAKITKFRFTNTLKEELKNGKLLKVKMASAQTFVNNGTTPLVKTFEETQRYTETFRFERIDSLSKMQRVEVAKNLAVETGTAKTNDKTSSDTTGQENRADNESQNSRDVSHGGSSGSNTLIGSTNESGTSNAHQRGTTRRQDSGSKTGSTDTNTNTIESSSSQGGSSTHSEHTGSSSTTGEENVSSSGSNIGSKVSVGTSASAGFGPFSASVNVQAEVSAGYSQSNENRRSSSNTRSQSSDSSRTTNSQVSQGQSSTHQRGTSQDFHQSSGSEISNSDTSNIHNTNTARNEFSRNRQNTFNSQFHNQNRRLASSQNSISSHNELRRGSRDHATTNSGTTNTAGASTDQDERHSKEYSTQQIKEILTREVFTVPPCVIYEKNTFMQEKRDMPFEFEVEVEFSEAGGCLTADQLRKELPEGMTYVRDLNEFAILGKTKGRIIASLGIKSEVEIHEERIPECQRRLMGEI